jgi:hypothetical protein
MGTDFKNGDCKINMAQNIAELIFGTTIVRGLKQTFDIKQYKPCNNDEIDLGTPGKLTKEQQNAVDALKVIMGIALVIQSPLTPIAILYFTLIDKLCFKPPNKFYNPECPAGYVKELKGGLCFADCMDHARQLNKITQKEYTDWIDSKKDVKKQLYQSDKMITCYRRYSDMDDMSNSDLNQQGQNGINSYFAVTPKIIPAECPKGTHKSTSLGGNVGAMCMDNCKDGYFENLGTCYKNGLNADKARGQLIKPRDQYSSLTPCDPGQRDDLVSCWDDFKCETSRGLVYPVNSYNAPIAGCSSNERDDGTSCWGNGACHWEGLKLKCNRSDITASKFDRMYCNNNDKLNKGVGRCLQTSCDNGYTYDGELSCKANCSGSAKIVKTLMDRTGGGCKPGEDKIGLICYKPCSEGYKPDLTGLSCIADIYTPESKSIINVGVCNDPVANQNQSGLCHQPCPAAQSQAASDASKILTANLQCFRDSFIRPGINPFGIRVKEREVAFGTKDN